MRKSKISRDSGTVKKFKIKCPSCSGYSYAPQNIRTCDYCQKLVHKNAGIKVLVAQRTAGK